MDSRQHSSFKAFILCVIVLLGARPADGTTMRVIPYLPAFVRDADVIAKATIKSFDYGDDASRRRFYLFNRFDSGSNPNYDEYRNIEFQIEEVLKGDKSLSMLAFPKHKTRRPIHSIPYEIGQSFLLFVGCASPDHSPGHPKPSSWPVLYSVRLNGHKKKDVFGDDVEGEWKRVEYSWPELFDRVRQIVTEPPSEVLPMIWARQLDKGDWAGYLERTNFDTSTNEGLMWALKASSDWARLCALHLLTERKAPQLTELLKEALDGDRLNIRIAAAHMLYTLGDRSGLSRMREDFKTLYFLNGITEPDELDRKLGVDRIRRRRKRPKRGPQIFYILQIAQVLAEMGDASGYEVAAQLGIKDAWDHNRLRAAKVLFEIAEANIPVSPIFNPDPVAVLSAAAKCERMREVYRYIVKRATKTLTNDAIRILTAAMENPHQSEEMLHLTRRLYDKLRKN